MAKSSYAKSKNRAKTGRFFALPNAVHDSPNWPKLSPSAVKLLIDLGMQYNGINNGNLTVAHKVLQKHGWKNRTSIVRARDELIHFGFIEQARQGGLHNGPSLYSITWQPIDECLGLRWPLEAKPTRVASGLYKHAKPPLEKPSKP